MSFLQLFVCIFSAFFKGFTHFLQLFVFSSLSLGIYSFPLWWPRSSSYSFKIFSLYFSYVEICTACCGWYWLCFLHRSLGIWVWSGYRTRCCLCWVNALFRSFYFLSGFSECDGCVLSSLLVWSIGVFIGNACGCWKLGFRDEQREEGWEKMVCGFHRRCEQR